MTQQINLLNQEREKKSILIPSLIANAILLIILMVYWLLVHMQTVKIQEGANKVEQQLNAAKKTMQTLQQQLASGEKAGDLDNEIAALKVRSEAGQELLNLLQKGELGNPYGYASYLTKLMKISRNDLWLTNISIENAGKNLSISGRALNSESIMNYAQRLNQEFADFGIVFTSIDIKPEVLGEEGTASPALSTIVFKLS